MWDPLFGFVVFICTLLELEILLKESDASMVFAYQQ